MKLLLVASGSLCRRALLPRPAVCAMAISPLLRGAGQRHLSTRSEAHATLGLPPDATLEQVKGAYYKLAMMHHPDRSTEPDAAERFAAIGAAYNAILGLPERVRRDSKAREGPQQAPFAAAFPPWVYRTAEYLHRVPQRLDTWLAPSYASTIYHHLRREELAEALEVLEEMRLEGEQPSHAVYEMLIRGCTIAMRRPSIGEQPDHLTVNLVQRVLELWGDMEKMGRKPDYLTYIELMRAFGKGGATAQALQLFEKMCNSVRLLPEQRAFNTIYEVCVLNGAYSEALRLFGEHEEMRKSLWKPRFTPVSFSLLLTAAAEQGPELAARVRHLPRLLHEMGSHGVLPRVETCERLVRSCLEVDELGIAQQVVQLAARAGHTIDPKLAAAVAAGGWVGEDGDGRRDAAGDGRQLDGKQQQRQGRARERVRVPADETKPLR